MPATPSLTNPLGQGGTLASANAGVPVPPYIHDGEGVEYPVRRKLRVLSLFAGIGGFDLGLERTGGFETVAFCEIEPFARRVLAKHWPEVPCYHDVRELTSDRLSADGISIDVICGGFPCQDISFAGLGAGLAGERSGLWSEIARLAGELRPQFLILENVAALLSRGLGDVLGDLAALGYDAEWHCIPAGAVGAPHVRDRIWIVAYPSAQRPAEAGPNSERPSERAGGGASVLADAESGEARRPQPPHCNGEVDLGRPVILASLRGCDGMVGASDWHTEPAICRVADGVSANVDRVAKLGNAVVPQIPELIGRAILASLNLPNPERQPFDHAPCCLPDAERFTSAGLVSFHEPEIARA